jgi:hypothetical protein
MDPLCGVDPLACAAAVVEALSSSLAAAEVCCRSSNTPAISLLLLCPPAPPEICRPVQALSACIRKNAEKPDQGTNATMLRESALARVVVCARERPKKKQRPSRRRCKGLASSWIAPRIAHATASVSSSGDPSFPRGEQPFSRLMTVCGHE